MEDRGSQDDEVPRGVWEIVETKVGKVRLTEIEGEREKEEKEKKYKRKENRKRNKRRERREEGENNRSKETGKEVGNLG